MLLTQRKHAEVHRRLVTVPRLFRVLAPAVLLAVAIAATFIGLAIGGAADPRALVDPGAFVRYGTPISRTILNIALSGLLGSTLMAVWAFATDRDEYRVAMDVAAASAALSTAASGAVILFAYLDFGGLELSAGPLFSAGLAQFLTEVELGQLWLFSLILSAVTTVAAFAFRGRRSTLIVLFLALVAFVPIASQGHAAGASGHMQAVNALLVHVIGAAAWIGGLAVLVFVSRSVDRERLSTLTARYSPIALLAFIGVAASGVVAAMQRLGSFDALFNTGYGQLIIGKTVTLLVLGAFGAVQRQWMIPRIATSPNGGKIFGWLVVSEIAVMGIVSGFAGSLGRTATPVNLDPARDQGGKITPAEWLTGDPLPPELGFEQYFTQWRFDIAWTLVCVFAAAFYIAGVIRLRKRGDKWPIPRLVVWLLGLLVLFYSTNGALNAYEQYLFSTHMLMHMLLTMLIPLMLVLGAPVTLALRAVHKRDDGSWGGREWIMWMVQTPYSKFITNPIVAAVIFVGSLWIFYFTPIMRWSMEAHLGHQWMIIHFLISGYLFSLTMIGTDPIPYRFPYPLRLVVLFATMASHAFFGVTLMTGDNLLGADWFGAMARPWGGTPLEDQALGGGIAWGIGELPTLALALVVAVQWSRNDRKEQKRRDRAADRLGDVDLEAYNAMLAQQAARDERAANRARR